MIYLDRDESNDEAHDHQAAGLRHQLRQLYQPLVLLERNRHHDCEQEEDEKQGVGHGVLGESVGEHFPEDVVSRLLCWVLLREESWPVIMACSYDGETIILRRHYSL